MSHQPGMISSLGSQTPRNMIQIQGVGIFLWNISMIKSLSLQTILSSVAGLLNLNLDMSARLLQVIFLLLWKEFQLALISNNLKIYDTSLQAQVESGKPWLVFLYLASFRSLAKHISTGWEESPMHIKQVIKIRLTVSRGLVIFYDLKMETKITFEHPDLFDSNTWVVFDGTGSLPLRIMLSKLETIYSKKLQIYVCLIFFYCLFVWFLGGLSFREIESVTNIILFPSQAF